MKTAFRSARTAVVAALLQNERLSRLELSSLASVSPAAITEVTQHLLEQGLLRETPAATTGRRRGRPTVQLSLQAAHSCFAGVSIGEAETVLAVTDLCGAVLYSSRVSTSHAPATLVAALKEAFAKALRATGVPRSRVRGVGLCVPGMVDNAIGVCRFSAGLNWRDVPLAQLVSRALRVPAWIDNDANAVAVGEKTFGRAREYDNFSSVVLGSTVGSAHYMHGMLYRGHDGSAGEIGHVTVHPKGLPCRCGRKGCLDTVAGGYAVQHAAGANGIRVKTMAEMEELARHGNHTAGRILRTAGEALGTAVAALVHLNNPEAVVFTDLAGFGNGIFRAATRQAIENGILPRFLNSTALVLGDEGALPLPRSAASIAAFHYLMSL